MNPTQVIFTPPTTNEGDNSPVTPGEIAKYIVAIGLVVAAPAVQTFPIVFEDLDVTPNVDGTIAVPLASFGTLAPGDYAAIVTAVTALNVSSPPSPVGLFTIAAPVVTPNAPSAPKFV